MGQHKRKLESWEKYFVHISPESEENHKIAEILLGCAIVFGWAYFIASKLPIHYSNTLW